MTEEAKRERVGTLLPVITNFDRWFWESLSEGKLLIQVCEDCGHAQFPPSPACTNCLSERVDWQESTNRATLWSKVRFHKAYLAPYSDVPYAVGIGRLEQGCLISGRISEKVYEEQPLDSEMTIQFCKTLDGTVIIEFVPDNTQTGGALFEKNNQ